jgi:hypothetical protein
MLHIYPPRRDIRTLGFVPHKVTSRGLRSMKNRERGCISRKTQLNEGPKRNPASMVGAYNRVQI